MTDRSVCRRNMVIISKRLKNGMGRVISNSLGLFRFLGIYPEGSYNSPDWVEWDIFFLNLRNAPFGGALGRSG